eukprot:TRINITY_DN15905_c0_g2_i1.p2 TRINITY_DN15905_c0_g2~~TRINITY_DN15905_c0_g2_i1.p2  ORF type:complete len:163 (+),score=12.31 TRINITY_DN15905_c0_g2_i1:203-691(+)
MVLLVIAIRAELENLTNLRPAADDFTYYFRVKCSCGEVSAKESSVTKGEEYEMKGSRGTANLVQKCTLCARVGSISLVDGHAKPLTAEDSEARRFAPLVCLDCRGMEPVEFFPKDGWRAEGAESGTVFGEIDLSEGEYSDYDERAGESVSILNIESEIKVKK